MFLFGQLASLSSFLKLAHDVRFRSSARSRADSQSSHCSFSPPSGCWDLSFGAWQTPESGPPDVSVSPPGAAFVHQLGDLEILKAFAPAFSIFCPVPNWNFVPVSPTYSFTVFVYKCAGQTG